MPIWKVHYSVAGHATIATITATEFKWLSPEEVEFLDGDQVVARFASVSAVVDSGHLAASKHAAPTKITFG